MVIVKLFLLLLSELDYCNLKIRLLLKPEDEAVGEDSYSGLASHLMATYGIDLNFCSGDSGLDCVMLLEFNHVVIGIHILQYLEFSLFCK